MDRDAVRSRPSRSLLGVAVAARHAPKRLYRFVVTPPGVMTLVSMMCVLAILAAGGAMVSTSSSQQDEVNTLITRNEPLADAAQEIFNNLSVADSIATTGFLKQSQGNNDSEAEYIRAIRDASFAVLRASHGISEVDSREMEIALHIQQELPKYITLIAQAQTNDRMRNPIGASYLTEASALMQGTLLPHAQELHLITSRQVADKQATLMRPLWFPISGLLAAVIILFIVQIWLSAETHRRFNLGFLLATALMVCALLWASGNSLSLWANGAQKVESTVQPLQELTQARITSQQARTDEALGLVQRDYDMRRQETFSLRMTQISQALENSRDVVESPARVDNAREALRLWDSAHAGMLYQMNNGHYNEALKISFETSSDPKSSGPNYAILDSELQALISDQREDLRDLLNDARRSANRVTNIVALLTLLAAISVLFGMRPRLQEYV